eukprot:SAG31_NODE_29360_length_396_cov_1.043771_1_plen_33_part_10
MARAAIITAYSYDTAMFDLCIGVGSDGCRSSAS